MNASFYIEAPVTGNPYGEPNGYPTLDDAINHAVLLARVEFDIDLDIVDSEGEFIGRAYADGEVIG